MERHAERVRLLLVRDRGLDRLRCRRRRRSRSDPRAARRTSRCSRSPAVGPAPATRGRGASSIAIVSRSASRSRLMTTTGSEGETWRSRPSRAPAGTSSSSSVRLAGTHPRRRMSSVNDVMVSSCAIFGSLTNVPAPRRRTSKPSRTSSSSAARTVSRETPRSVLSWRSEGIASPTPSRSIRSSTWLARLALLGHGSRASGPPSASAAARRPLRRLPSEALARSRRSKKWNREGSTASAGGAARARCPGIDARGEERARVREQRRSSSPSACASTATCAASTRKKTARPRRAPRDLDLDARRGSAGARARRPRTPRAGCPRITSLTPVTGRRPRREGRGAAEARPRRPRPSPRRGSSRGIR